MHQVIFYLLILISFASLASERQEIIWLSDDENYVKNFRQPMADNIDSDTNNLLLAKIKQYDIRLQYTPLGRIEKLMTSGDNYCIANRLKNATRIKENLFSLPVNLFVGLRLYSSQAIEPTLINATGELNSLHDLFLAKPENVLLVSRGRSYGDILDQQVGEIAEKNIYVLSGQSYIQAAFEMLAHNRVDYIIEYPAEVTMMLRKHPRALNVNSVSIKGSKNYVIGYLACNKSAIGEKFIAYVNTLLKDLYQSEAFYQAHVRHLTPADVAVFTRYFNQEFATSYKVSAN